MKETRTHVEHQKALRLVRPAEWRPSTEFGRAILRLVLAVKQRRDEGDRKDAA